MWAQQLAGDLLAEALPRRWSHSQGVGRKAEAIGHLAGDDADLLICAAWLHDIGYAPKLVDTGLRAVLTVPATSGTSSTPTRGCALWSPTTPAPASRPATAASVTCSPPSSILPTACSPTP